MLYEDWTEDQIVDRIEEVEAELEELGLGNDIIYLIDEGFIEVEEIGEGDFAFYPIAEAEYIEIPI